MSKKSLRVIKTKPQPTQNTCSPTQTLTLSQTIQLANQYYNAGQLPAAETLCQQILQVDSQNSIALYLLGLIADKTGNTAAAINLLKQAIRSNQSVPAFHGNLGNFFKKQGKLEEALQCYQQVLRLDPNSVEAYNNLGNISKNQGHLDLAVTYFQQAIALKPNWPNAHVGYSLTLLKQGDFNQGWPEYEWRFKNNQIDTPQLNKPLWDGTPLAGQTLLVHWEQGFGDTIQFSRYLFLIKGGTLLFASPAALTPLFKHIPNVAKVISHNQLDSEPEINYDIWISLLSLPQFFTPSLESIPAPIPYLHPDPIKVKQWQSRFAYHRFKIGIVWAGNPKHQDDRNRSCSLTYFMAIAKLPQISLISLQKGEAAKQTIPNENQFMSLSEELTDFSDTAAVIAHLDLVISVDTATAHLAGAMGKPVWILLPVNSDWRWLIKREDTPWYPTMRLFRQSVPGNWQEVFDRMVTELTTLVTQNNHNRLAG